MCIVCIFVRVVRTMYVHTEHIQYYCTVHIQQVRMYKFVAPHSAFCGGKHCNPGNMVCQACWYGY